MCGLVAVISSSIFSLSISWILICCAMLVNSFLVTSSSFKFISISVMRQFYNSDSADFVLSVLESEIQSISLHWGGFVCSWCYLFDIY